MKLIDNENSIFVKLLKEKTTIDDDFIDTFFTKFEIGDDLNFDIKDTDVAKYLGINIKTLRQRLRNTYSENENYMNRIDYIKFYDKNNNNTVMYMLNYKCFERLAMSGYTEESERVRFYFVKLREFLTDNQELIYQALEKHQEDKLRIFSGYESIYFFAADERVMDWKIGRTKDIILRLRNYNIGRIKSVDLKYYAIVKNAKIIEKCIKLELKKNQVIKDREIYRVDPKKLKKVIMECYCKNVSKEEHEEFYLEMANLLELYSYTKNSKHIKPFIVIDKK